MKMDNSGKNWVLYPWFEDDGFHMIHPDDLARFLKRHSNGLVFECSEDLEGYVLLRYADDTYRVKPDLMQSIAAPQYSFGQKLVVIRNDRIGDVCDIHWHFKHRQPHYYLKVDGKKHKTRYVAADLRPF
jgi:hypothetical protein